VAFPDNNCPFRRVVRAAELVECASATVTPPSMTSLRFAAPFAAAVLAASACKPSMRNMMTVLFASVVTGPASPPPLAPAGPSAPAWPPLVPAAAPSAPDAPPAPEVPPAP